MSSFVIDGTELTVRDQEDLLGSEGYETTVVKVQAGGLAADLNFEVVFRDRTTMSLVISGGSRDDGTHPDNLRHPKKVLAYAVVSELVPDGDDGIALGSFYSHLYNLKGINSDLFKDRFYDDKEAAATLSENWRQGVLEVMKRNPLMLKDAWSAFLAYKALSLDDVIKREKASLESLIRFQQRLVDLPFDLEGIYPDHGHDTGS